MLAREKAAFNSRRTLLAITVVLLITVIFTGFLPEDVSKYGAFSLAPAIFLIIYIFATKRILEALILSSLIGLSLIHIL